jgi:hypothetical protein
MKLQSQKLIGFACEIYRCDPLSVIIKEEYSKTVFGQAVLWRVSESKRHEITE